MKHFFVTLFLIFSGFVFSQDNATLAILQKNLEISASRPLIDSNAVFSIDKYNTGPEELLHMARVTSKKEDLSMDELKKFVNLYLLYKLKVIEATDLNYLNQEKSIDELNEYRKKVQQSNYDSTNFVKLVQQYQEGMIVFNLTKDSVWDKASMDSILIETAHKNSAKYKDMPLKNVKGYVVAELQDDLYAKWMERIIRRHKIVIFQMNYDAFLSKSLSERTTVQREAPKKQGTNPLFYSEEKRDKKGANQDPNSQNDVLIMVVSTEVFNENNLITQVKSHGKPMSEGAVLALQVLNTIVQGLPNDRASGIFLTSNSKNVMIKEMAYSKTHNYIFINEGSIGLYKFKDVCIYKNECYQL